MGVWKAKKAENDKAHKRDPFLDQLGPFRCSYCVADLALERVVSVDVHREGDGAPTGYLTVEHTCACSPAETRASLVLGTQFGIISLFGTPPALPYRAGFRWRDVPADDPTVARWRWELEQVADWDDFMLFLGAGPAK